MGRKRKIRFRAGDDVQIVRRAQEDDTWCSAMDKTIGEFGKVIETDDNYVLVEVYQKGYRRDSQKWWYFYADLTNIKSDELDDMSVGDVMGFFE